MELVIRLYFDKSFASFYHFVKILNSITFYVYKLLIKYTTLSSENDQCNDHVYDSRAINYIELSSFKLMIYFSKFHITAKAVGISSYKITHFKSSRPTKLPI